MLSGHCVIRTLVLLGHLCFQDSTTIRTLCYQDTCTIRTPVLSGQYYNQDPVLSGQHDVYTPHVCLQTPYSLMFCCVECWLLRETNLHAVMQQSRRRLRGFPLRLTTTTFSLKSKVSSLLPPSSFRINFYGTMRIIPNYI